jgi:hypothetical protein
LQSNESGRIGQGRLGQTIERCQIDGLLNYASIVTQISVQPICESTLAGNPPQPHTVTVAGNHF